MVDVYHYLRPVFTQKTVLFSPEQRKLLGIRPTGNKQLCNLTCSISIIPITKISNWCKIKIQLETLNSMTKDTISNIPKLRDICMTKVGVQYSLLSQVYIIPTTQHIQCTQHSTAQCNTAQHCTAQHSTVQHSTEQHSTMQHSTLQHSTVQQSTALHSTMQQSRAEHVSLVQHSIA